MFAFAAPAEPVQIVHLVPTTCFAPCSMRFEVRVPHDADNQALDILVDSETGMSFSSEIALSATGPTLFPRMYRSLPAGDYRIVITLVRHNGRSWVAGRATAQLTVLSSN